MYKLFGPIGIAFIACSLLFTFLAAMYVEDMYGNSVTCSRIDCSYWILIIGCIFIPAIIFLYSFIRQEQFVKEIALPERRNLPVLFLKLFLFGIITYIVIYPEKYLNALMDWFFK